jgi:hypothetical protein
LADLKASDGATPDHWLALPQRDLKTLYDAADAAMRDEWADQAKGFRHLMNCVLFLQLSMARSAIQSGHITAEAAAAAMRGDFGLGYLFGLAASYMDACELPRQGHEARTAIADVHTFTFGRDVGVRVIQEQDARGPDDFGIDFEAGIEAAHRDINAFKRLLMSSDAPLPAGLRDGLVRWTADRTPPSGRRFH